MEVHFTSETEKKLNDIALQSSVCVDRLVENVVEG